MNAKLIFKDKSSYEGKSFGAEKSISGEVVFATGMVGYPESLTDPSFRGQILVFTYPLLGNYGVPEVKHLESKKIQVAGVIVCNYNAKSSHHQSKLSLGQWLKKEGVPALEIKDTRELTLKLRTKGSTLGKIVINNKDVEFSDPNERNLVAEVSCKKPTVYGKGNPDARSGSLAKKNGKVIGKTIAVIDCGAKYNIQKRLVAKGLKVIVVPWNFNPLKLKQKIHAVLISNGPGDPSKVVETIENVKLLMKKKIPTLGICLGNQILALASGGTTYKLKFGHRGQNQPCVMQGTRQCVLTTQNHGFAVGKIPKGFKQWFYNANDNTNEGIIHKTLPFMSVQFHPEAAPGPTDADWIFDYFLNKI